MACGHVSAAPGDEGRQRRSSGTRCRWRHRLQRQQQRSERQHFRWSMVCAWSPETRVPPLPCTCHAFAIILSRDEPGGQWAVLGPAAPRPEQRGPPPAFPRDDASTSAITLGRGLEGAHARVFAGCRERSSRGLAWVRLTTSTNRSLQGAHLALQQPVTLVPVTERGDNGITMHGASGCPQARRT